MTKSDGTTSSGSYLSQLIATLETVDANEIEEGAALVERAWRRGAQVITLGNGGSAMSALHFVTDWGKMVGLATGRMLNARSLVDNMGLITAYSNDLSFEDVFVGQLKAVMRQGDLVVAISGSGNSENVIRAVDYANANGAETLGLCGFGGGRLRDRVSKRIWVRSNDMQICEDVHSAFGHIVMQRLCGAGKS